MARPSDPHAKIDLLRAAEAVFLEAGLDRARVEDITERAGRSKGSFYLHFQSKEDAFLQLVETVVARIAGVIDEGPPDPGEAIGPEEHIARWLEKDVACFEMLWSNRGVVRLVLGGGGSASFNYLIDEFAERARANVVRWLTWGKACGHYRDDLDVELVSLVLSGAYDRVARALVLCAKKPPIEAWLRQMQRVFLEGIGTPMFLEYCDQPVNKPRRAKK